MTSLVEASGICIPGRLASATVQLNGGELTGVIGPNGSGKTSLLRAIAGVEGSSGSVRIDGEEVAQLPPARRERLLAFLPASRDLVWPISAKEVITLTAAPGGLGDRTIRDLDLQPLLERPVNQLSTGERSRVLLARALAARARLLLLDEPLSNLDPYWAIRALETVASHVRDSGAAALLTLHDLNVIDGFDRIMGLVDGKVVADAAPAELLAGPVIGEMFGVERSGSGWAIRPEGRRSSQ